MVSIKLEEFQIISGKVTLHNETMISRGYYLIQSVDNELFPPIRSDKLNFSSDMNLYIIYVGMATSAADEKGIDYI